ncbi:ECF RNA polymerase sigma factor SigK [Pseudobythopirellula maris]|uniref:ECF RNA polymerase sigma factor SigK n=1 Tax=Pseudobythopirellula maris TaxID=2527991 RepID=A0A5C5ZR41_9BACT|nr:sigma-70 family RNA polymerase sigma factor [Pseudobythopirellula maris]TWT89964.1 ECF RNA polymerase sigma factor SigK [Pseudobythopirellula maris]
MADPIPTSCAATSTGLVDDEALSDNRLMAGVCEGQQDALATLYDRHSGMVYGLCLRVLGNTADAEGLVSDVFLEIWRKPHGFDPERGRFRSYLLTMARSRSIDRIRSVTKRSEKTHEAGVNHQAFAESQQSLGSPASQAIAEEHGRVIQEALGRLDPEQRTALQMAFYEGLTHREIAERLEAPLGTVKTRIRRGLQRMRGALDALGRVDGLQ